MTGLQISVNSPANEETILAMLSFLAGAIRRSPKTKHFAASAKKAKARQPPRIQISGMTPYGNESFYYNTRLIEEGSSQPGGSRGAVTFFMCLPASRSLPFSSSLMLGLFSSSLKMNTNASAKSPLVFLRLSLSFWNSCSIAITVLLRTTNLALSLDRLYLGLTRLSMLSAATQTHSCQRETSHTVTIALQIE